MDAYCESRFAITRCTFSARHTGKFAIHHPIENGLIWGYAKTVHRLHMSYSYSLSSSLVVIFYDGAGGELWLVERKEIRR